MSATPVALLFPPVWYFDAVPADLSYPAGALRRAGVPVVALDLSAEVTAHLNPDQTQRLQQIEAYESLTSQRHASSDLNTHAAKVGETHQIEYRPRRMRFPDVDDGSVPAMLRVGMDQERNPALPILEDAVRRVLSHRPGLVGIALVHPDQRLHALVLARLLRRASYQGVLVLYGSYEDVITPEDFAPDLIGQPRHHIFHDFNGVIVGESESALVALATQSEPTPNFFRPSDAELPPRMTENLTGLLPDFQFVQPQHHTTPHPVIDLRLSRGCPWGKCAFCAIQAHQVGYRVGPIEHVVEAMENAHDQTGTRYFRLRDDLLTPSQLSELGSRLREHGFFWTARARFQSALTLEKLKSAAQGGLTELWMGLESAVPRVRTAMDKGVEQEVIVQNLSDAHTARVPIRALCLVGFPGETMHEAYETVRFVAEHHAWLVGASLTPFMLTRRSPLANNLDAHGLAGMPDPIPRWQRIRHTIDLEPDGHLGPDITRRILHETYGAWKPLLDRLGGPSPIHDWVGRTIRSATNL